MLIPGQVVGRLTVEKVEWRTKGYRVYFRCQCGEAISDTLTQVNRGKRKSCGKLECSRKPGYGNGSRRKDKHGYIVFGKKKKERFEHRLVMEQVLGRPLLRSEAVHHLNGIKDDNRPENLSVMTHSEHSKLHRETDREVHRLRIENAELREELSRLKNL